MSNGMYLSKAHAICLYVCLVFSFLYSCYMAICPAQVDIRPILCLIATITCRKLDTSAIVVVGKGLRDVFVLFNLLQAFFAHMNKICSLYANYNIVNVCSSLH